jgi:hypothetical protein
MDKIFLIALLNYQRTLLVVDISSKIFSAEIPLPPKVSGGGGDLKCRLKHGMKS